MSLSSLRVENVSIIIPNIKLVKPKIMLINIIIIMMKYRLSKISLSTIFEDESVSLYKFKNPPNPPSNLKDLSKVLTKHLRLKLFNSNVVSHTESGRYSWNSV